MLYEVITDSQGRYGGHQKQEKDQRRKGDEQIRRLTHFPEGFTRIPLQRRARKVLAGEKGREDDGQGGGEALPAVDGIRQENGRNQGDASDSPIAGKRHHGRPADKRENREQGIEAAPPVKKPDGSERGQGLADLSVQIGTFTQVEIARSFVLKPFLALGVYRRQD